MDFPVVPKAARPRRLVFRSVSEGETAKLAEKGYEVVELLTLPRRTPVESREYISALLQGVSDGTIMISKQEYEAVELEAKILGMLAKDGADRDGALKLEVGKTLAKALDWKHSRHTLRDNMAVGKKK